MFVFQLNFRQAKYSASERDEFVLEYQQFESQTGSIMCGWWW